MEHVKVLSQEIGVRSGGSAGEDEAEEYIATVYKNAGLDVVRQPFTRPDGGTSHNVIGRIPGVDYSRPYVVLGAHYDTVRRSPGANDNASGTGVVVSLAETISARKLALPIEFIAFSVEERQPASQPGPPGLLTGSRAYVEALDDPKARVASMISIDMIGNGPALLLVRYSESGDQIQKELAAAATITGDPHVLSTKGAVSDHGPFCIAGVPCAFLYSGDHPSYHKPTDVYSVVQPESVGRTGRITLQWLKTRFGFQ